MIESNVEKLIAEASQALDSQQYSVAEDLQRRAIRLLAPCIKTSMLLASRVLMKA
jgi:hypothetical protein